MEKLATPLYRMNDEDKRLVYEPSEDTFLLMDALEMDAARIRDAKPQICVEVGCGSGVITAFIAKHLAKYTSGGVCFATDLNPAAVSLTGETARLNQVQAATDQASLVIAIVSGSATINGIRRFPVSQCLPDTSRPGKASLRYAARLR